MLELLLKLVFLTPLKIHNTNTQDLNPRSSSDNDHQSVLTHVMMEIEPGEKSSRHSCDPV